MKKSFWGLISLAIIATAVLCGTISIMNTRSTASSDLMTKNIEVLAESESVQIPCVNSRNNECRYIIEDGDGRKYPLVEADRINKQ
jgi:hypothetical protein